MRTYRPSDEVDFLVVGSGAAGGVMARELSRPGFSVVVLEQGPWLTERDFHHDALQTRLVPEQAVRPGPDQPHTLRRSAAEAATRQSSYWYGRCVGGGTVVYSANYWRFPEIEFEQASRLGVPDGSSVADWPIRYADLEPYYTKVEWEIGVSGRAGNPFEPWRSRDFPLPPLPIKSEGVLAERGASQLGWHAWPTPMAILSRSWRGRSGCIHCGYCSGYGCEVGAKSSTLVTMIPAAVATGRCEIRPHCFVRRIEVSPAGRVTGATYFDRDRREVFQRAKAVVLCANGIESPRLLLLSANRAFPQGLANASGQVGRNLMFNDYGAADAIFAHPINGWKGVVASRVIWDFFELPASEGLYGGGGFDIRNGADTVWGREPTWGSAWKKRVATYNNHAVQCLAHTTQLPVASDTIDLDPELKDGWGLPVPRVTKAGHPMDVKVRQFFMNRTRELLQAAGAEEVSPPRVARSATAGGNHLLGTCRMGRDPATSVVDADHRSHEVRNLFIVDGSSFVTSGRGMPTMTIQALAFRAADRITQLARASDI